MSISGEDTCESEEDICKQLSNGGDNHDMKLLIIKMKAMFTWRHNHLTNRFHTMVSGLTLLFDLHSLYTDNNRLITMSIQ